MTISVHYGDYYYENVDIDVMLDTKARFREAERKGNMMELAAIVEAWEDYLERLTSKVLLGGSHWGFY